MASTLLPYLGLDEVMDKTRTLKAIIAEFTGTLFLVFIGCGSCLENPGTDGGVTVRIALAFGVTVATMAQGLGHVSGCHVNPAVTAGLLFGRKIGIIKALLYVTAQVLGALVGSGLLKAVTTSGDDASASSLGMTTVTNISPGQATGIEFLITFVLVTVVFAAAADEANAPSVKGSAPLAIGLSITACHLFAIPFTGSSMNPARTFGPAVVTGIWDNHWVYWVGPLLGGVCASLLYQLTFKAQPQELREPYSEVTTKEEKTTSGV